MKTPLSPKQAFSLYGVILACVLTFYVMGLLVARQYLIEDPVATVDLQTAPPLEDVTPMLGVYDKLEAAGGEKHPQPSAPRPATGAPAEISKRPTPTFVVQVGAYSSEEEARQVLLRLKAKQIEGRLVRPLPDGADSFFRVWVGQEVASEEKAYTIGQELKALGFPCYIKKLN